MEYNLFVGMIHELEFTVTKKDTTSHLGDGSIPVFSTPSMVGFIEETCLKGAKTVLPLGYDTVGTSFNITHLAPTPLGMSVRVKAELIEMKGSSLTYKIKVYAEKNKISEGTHGRAVIETEKFLEKTSGLK